MGQQSLPGCGDPLVVSISRISQTSKNTHSGGVPFVSGIDTPEIGWHANRINENSLSEMMRQLRSSL
ncbi:hypothetical protein [Rhizobium leguminosarum]|uniref:hypothetical protein n=1 Tax=Rhizobium leguminosarum TaxID=384 RepID=UPI00160B624D|nr:hypothetical protein [Rhizobium leguminosarum]MBB5261792.1 hypothetical protein [Rhizobium leguminosarum]